MLTRRDTLKLTSASALAAVPIVPLTETDTTFSLWLKELDAIAAKGGAIGTDGRTYSQVTGPECWLDMFDDGMTPAEAWSEELHAAATMGDV